MSCFVHTIRYILFPVRKHIFHAYIAFLGRSLGSCASVNNYLAALKKVNILMGAEIDFMTDIESSLLKWSLRKILGENGNRKEEINIEILSGLCKVLDDSIPLHACMKALFLVAFFSFLRKSNLLPRSQLEAAEGQGMFLRHQDVTFKADSVLLRIYRTKNFVIQV